MVKKWGMVVDMTILIGFFVELYVMFVIGKI